VQDVRAFRSVGAVIQERFVIEELLGQGGFSAVYLVRDEQDEDKKYALKELIDYNRQEKNNFAFECKVLKRLDHPALPHVHWVTENNDRTYLFMDYIEGATLDDYIRNTAQAGKFPPPRDIVYLFKPISSAIAYAHQKGIFPGNITAANILLN